MAGSGGGPGDPEEWLMLEAALRGDLIAWWGIVQCLRGRRQADSATNQSATASPWEAWRDPHR